MNNRTTWHPTETVVRQANLSLLMKEQGARTFDQIHAWSVQNPEAFWQRTVKALGVTLRRPYKRIFDVSQGVNRARWLAGAQLNLAESCFQGPQDRIAIITRRQDGRMETLTLEQLDRLSNRVANGLVHMGLAKGDAVAMDMAMSAEAAAIYLGIVKMGGAVVSIAESFPPEEIHKRLQISKAKATFTQQELVRSGKRFRIYDKVCQALAPQTIVLDCPSCQAVARRSGDKVWQDFLSADDQFPTISCSPQDPLSILFSSGTTGEPKAIPWDHTSPIRCASDALYHHDVKTSDVLCWPTSLGWMMGPWLIFAGLLNRATVAIYEGGPLERGFCEFVKEAAVTMLGVVPSMVKAWRNTGCADKLDWSRLRMFSSTGEASNARDYSWLMKLNQPDGVLKPVIEYCGGTELAGGYLTNNLLLPQKPGEFNGKTMGTDFVVLKDDGTPCQHGEMGEVFLVPPALGMSTHLLNADNNEVYYESCPTWHGKVLRRHGDRMICHGANRFQSEGRADNTMNLGGIKVGSAEIERVVNAVSGTVETAAIGIPPLEGGADRLIIFVVPEKGANLDQIKPEMQRAIKEHLNPLYHLHDVVFVEALPRTASHKVMHRKLRARFRSRESAVLAGNSPHLDSTVSHT